MRRTRPANAFGQRHLEGRAFGAHRHDPAPPEGGRVVDRAERIGERFGRFGDEVAAEGGEFLRVGEAFGHEARERLARPHFERAVKQKPRERIGRAVVRERQNSLVHGPDESLALFLGVKREVGRLIVTRADFDRFGQFRREAQVARLRCNRDGKRRLDVGSIRRASSLLARTSESRQ